jgi:hypothetical protein
MSNRVQLNTRVESELREKVKQDSDRFGRKVTRDVVVGAILNDFFKSWTLTQRGEFYKKYLTKEIR